MASKSFGKPSLDPNFDPRRTYRNGVVAERVCSDHYLNLGYTLLFQRLRTPCGEIDLIFKKDDLIVCVEVKLIQNRHFFPTAVSRKQKERLVRACEFLLRFNVKKVELHLAIVSHKGEVQIFKNFLD